MAPEVMPIDTLYSETAASVTKTSQKETGSRVLLMINNLIVTLSSSLTFTLQRAGAAEQTHSLLIDFLDDQRHFWIQELELN